MVAIIIPSRWCFRRADWALFRNATEISQSPFSFPSIDKALDYFLDVVIKASENSIPRVMPSSKPRVPFWNPECREAIRERNKALRHFYRTKCPEDFIKYKLFKTKARRILRITRRAYTKYFLSLLNFSLPTNVMYKRIRRFVHHNDYNPPIVLRYDDDIISSPLIVASALGSAFASHFREFSKEFYKAREFERRIDFSVGTETPGNFYYPYNKLFTLDEYEFKAALSSCGEGASGPDEIFYSIL